MKALLILVLFGLGIGLLATGGYFYTDPTLLSAEVTMGTGLAFFHDVLPAGLAVAGLLIAFIGLWDGVNRLSDALIIPLGLIDIALAVGLWRRYDDTIALLDMFFPEGNAVTLLAVLIGAFGIPPLYAAWMLAIESHYPCKRPAGWRTAD